LLDVVKRSAPSVPAGLFTLIALFAVSNTALLNFVMGSRLVYGMSRQGLLPAALGLVHSRRQTPHVAILVIAAATIWLALSGTLTVLAGTTSVLLLAVFFLVNLSLIVIKRRAPTAEAGFGVPLAVPIAGACASLGLMLFAQIAILIFLLGFVFIGVNHILRRTLS
jgi:amino acid transporter